MPESQLNSDILEKFQAGDHSAFKMVFEHFNRQMKYFCQRLIGNQEDAKDIAIETFHKLFHIHTKFKTYSNIKAFLYITARNSCLNYLQAKKSQNEKKKHFMADHLPTSDMLEEVEIQTEMLQLVYRKIAKLPPSCKEVLTLLYVNDFTPHEVAEKMNITVKNVYAQRSYAIKLLRLTLFDTAILVASLHIVQYFND